MANIKTFKKGDRTKIAANFSAKEFDCKCSKCDKTLIDLDHIVKLQQLREDLNASITINSAYRCPAHNAAVGGSSKSQHKRGTATDIVVSDMGPDEVADACEHFDGLGRYESFTHIDSRGSSARWDKRKVKDLLPNGPTEDDINISLADLERDLGL